MAGNLPATGPVRAKRLARYGSAVMAAAVAAAGLLGGARAAGAKEADVRIGELDCAATPEAVSITNTGAETVTLAGWKLQSDPPGEQSLDLSPAGSLSPGETVLIQSGPGAAGVFVWTQEQVFRDGDPTDYARIVDAGGNTVHSLACAGAPTPTLAAAEVPDGGGPPGAAGAALWPLMAAGAGGTLALGGLAAMMLAAVSGFSSRAQAAPMPAAAARPVCPRKARRPSSPAPYLAVASAAVLAAAVVAILSRRATGRG